MGRNVLILAAGVLGRQLQPWRSLDPALGDTGLLVVPPDAGCEHSPIPVHEVKGYYDTASVEEVGADAHLRFPFTDVVELSEYDVDRAAALRECFGLVGGTTRRQAATGRDKALMKSLWARAGIPAARHAVLAEASDLRRFAASNGYPVVVKPRAAAGSKGVTVLHDDLDRRQWLAEHWHKDLLDPNMPSWIAEEFVDGSIIQVDALLTERGLEYLWPSRVSDLLAWQADAPPLTITMCDPGDPVVPRAQRLVRQAIVALDPHPAVTVVHAEMFERASDGALLMSEIAWRPGGLLTSHMITTAFGVDIIERYLTALLRPERLVGEVPSVPDTVAGQVGVARREGTVESVSPLPQTLRAAASIAYGEILVEPGRTYLGTGFSTDLAAKAVVTGANAAEVAARQRAVADYIDAHGICMANPAPARARRGLETRAA